MAVITFSHARQIVTVLFPGIAAIDTADTEAIVRPQGSGTFHVVGLEILRTSGIVPGSSGTTSVKVSLSSLGDGITESITEAARRSATIESASPGLEFTAGDPIYVHRSAVAGGHVDLEVAVHILMA